MSELLLETTDLARHYSGKRQPAPYGDSPGPDGGSLLFTDGSVVWTRKLYAWNQTHLIATPERFDAGGL